MNTSVHPDGTIKALAEFYGRDFQEYKPGKVFAPFYKSDHSDYTCGNPIIIGHCKTGRLAWQEQWIEVCKAENGKWGYGMNTASDSCEGHNQFSSWHAMVIMPHRNYAKLYVYNNAEDAIRAAIGRIKASIEAIGPKDNKGTLKMALLAERQLAPEYEQLTLF